MITRGTKQMISRVREEITAWMGLPTAWKKIEVILMAQVRTTRARKIPEGHFREFPVVAGVGHIGGLTEHSYHKPGAQVQKSGSLRVR